MAVCKNCAKIVPDKFWDLKKVNRYPMFYAGNGHAYEDVPRNTGPRGGSSYVGADAPTGPTEWIEFDFCCKTPKR